MFGRRSFKIKLAPTASCPSGNQEIITEIQLCTAYTVPYSLNICVCLQYILLHFHKHSSSKSWQTGWKAPRGAIRTALWQWNSVIGGSRKWLRSIRNVFLFSLLLRTNVKSTYIQYRDCWSAGLLNAAITHFMWASFLDSSYLLSQSLELNCMRTRVNTVYSAVTYIALKQQNNFLLQ